MFWIIKQTLHLYKKVQKYLVDTLTLSSVTENDTWQKRLSTSALQSTYFVHGVMQNCRVEHILTVHLTVKQCTTVQVYSYINHPKNTSAYPLINLKNI